jgi:hypothetical protein
MLLLRAQDRKSVGILRRLFSFVIVIHYTCPEDRHAILISQHWLATQMPPTRVVLSPAVRPSMGMTTGVVKKIGKAPKKKAPNPGDNSSLCWSS